MLKRNLLTLLSMLSIKILYVLSVVVFIAGVGLWIKVRPLTKLVREDYIKKELVDTSIPIDVNINIEDLERIQPAL